MMFQDPRQLQLNHRRSNGTIEDFMVSSYSPLAGVVFPRRRLIPFLSLSLQNLIDEVMPQLSALLSSYETS